MSARNSSFLQRWQAARTLQPCSLSASLIKLSMSRPATTIFQVVFLEHWPDSWIGEWEMVNVLKAWIAEEKESGSIKVIEKRACSVVTQTWASSLITFMGQWEPLQREVLELGRKNYGRDKAESGQARFSLRSPHPCTPPFSSGPRVNYFLAELQSNWMEIENSSNKWFQSNYIFIWWKNNLNPTSYHIPN